MRKNQGFAVILLRLLRCNGCFTITYILTFLTLIIKNTIKNIKKLILTVTNRNIIILCDFQP